MENRTISELLGRTLGDEGTPRVRWARATGAGVRNGELFNLLWLSRLHDSVDIYAG